LYASGGTLNSANLGEGVKQGVISGITAAAVSEVAHGGENNASEFTTTEQLALQGLFGGISAELRGGKFQDGFPPCIIQKHHPRSNSPILKTTTPCFEV
jgi:hypothetical protein